MPQKVAAINSSKLLIAISNGNSPETFSHPCMINTNRGIQFTSNTSESILPYCPPDEDLPGWIEREGDSLSASITGAGVFDERLSDLELFWDWYLSQESKNIRVIVGDLGYYKGLWLLTAFNIAGPGRREKVAFDSTMLSDGPLDWIVTT